MYLLFDIGGSKTRLALSADLKEMSEPEIFSTPDTPEQIAPFIEDFLAEQTSGESLRGGFGGVTGVWDKERRELVHSPNMTGWVGRPVRDILSRAIGAEVEPANDADIVGLGEAVYGAGRDSTICVYITVSTGVGGARLKDQQIDSYTVGFEPGHQVIDYSRCLEDRYESTLEGRVSGTAVAQRFNMPPYEITEEQVWEELAEETAVGVYNCIIHWSPDTLVLGGSMIVGDPAIAVDRIEHYVKDLADFLPEIPEFRRAELGSIGGLYGAMAYAANQTSTE